MTRTRIAYIKNLNKGKLLQLKKIAKLLGNVRTQTWHEFGMFKWKKLHPFKAVGYLLKKQQYPHIPARLWKETVHDCLDDIKAFHATQKKLKVKRIAHGVSKVNNQIILDTGSYTTFKQGKNVWLAVQGIIKGKRIKCPLTTTFAPTKTLRLIIRDDDVVEVHYGIEIETVKDCGTEILGVDKGYTEVFVDNHGSQYGKGLGKLLTANSDKLKLKYQRRNKLFQLAQKNKKIFECNLGRKKLDRQKRRYEQVIKTEIYKAVHAIVDKASTVVCEDLTSPIPSKGYGKDVNRRLSNWTKGIIAFATADVAASRGSTVSYVNCAYTSQMDSRHGVLLGKRAGDKFHCFDRVVLQADTNAARNILARHYDTDIGRYMPYKKVKEVLLRRTELFTAECGDSGNCPTMALTCE